jgi:hypothetical protein
MITAGFTFFVAACAVWGIIVESLKPFSFVAAGIIAALIAFYYRCCCPQCGRRMMFRAEPMHPEAYRNRILFDCRHCDIVWDSGEIQNEG